MKYVCSITILTLLLVGGPRICAAADAAGEQSAETTAGPNAFRPPASVGHSPAKPPSLLARAVRIPDGPAFSRLALWSGVSLAQGLLACDKTFDIWGKPDGKFHLKNDFSDDQLALSDEVSHLLIAYKLAQLARQGYRWGGLSPAAAARAGAIQAAIYMAFVEFPLDAYNPDQGLGLTDLLADFAGIGLAWYRAGIDNPRWDLKVSVKSRFFAGNSRLLAHTNKQYDDFIYWLTYRISANRYNPLVLGIGYSTHHPPGDPPSHIPVDKQIYFRIGTSLSEIGRIFGRRTERLLSPAEVYFFNVGPRTSWR
ncbi:hypothetical protein ACFLQW_01155 [Candidatus Zixiibacteriota bacterium]